MTSRIYTRTTTSKKYVSWEKLSKHLRDTLLEPLINSICEQAIIPVPPEGNDPLELMLYARMCRIHYKLTRMPHDVGMAVRSHFMGLPIPSEIHVRRDILELCDDLLNFDHIYSLALTYMIGRGHTHIKGFTGSILYKKTTHIPKFIEQALEDYFNDFELES
jgi:hypothetical protein